MVASGICAINCCNATDGCCDEDEKYRDSGLRKGIRIGGSHCAYVAFADLLGNI
jgi:hypothetical protein